MIHWLVTLQATLDWCLTEIMVGGKGAQPEHRLPVMVLGSLINPIGLFLYGWTAQARLQWMAPISGTALIGFGLMVTIVPSNSYLVDAFGIHAASAIGAGNHLRATFGAVLPLAGPQLYQRLGLRLGKLSIGFHRFGIYTDAVAPDQVWRENLEEI